MREAEQEERALLHHTAYQGCPDGVHVLQAGRAADVQRELRPARRGAGPPAGCDAGEQDPERETQGRVVRGGGGHAGHLPHRALGANRGARGRLRHIRPGPALPAPPGHTHKAARRRRVASSCPRDAHRGAAVRHWHAGDGHGRQVGPVLHHAGRRHALVHVRDCDQVPGARVERGVRVHIHRLGRHAAGGHTRLRLQAVRPRLRRRDRVCGGPYLRRVAGGAHGAGGELGGPGVQVTRGAARHEAQVEHLPPHVTGRG
mmetsp:Transcript_5631/g.19556  ORF Transcript_5631/g.19556 Transcript_5631/m.19556 type:complete len:259 (-) Transcript_5631:1073-1849(-)